MNLRQILTRRLANAAGFFAGVVLALGVAWVVITPASSPHAPEPEPTRIDRLIAKHHCWTGEAPDGAIPGHAIVSPVDGKARLVSADEGFAIWLEDAPGTLHAFCP